MSVVRHDPVRPGSPRRRRFQQRTYERCWKTAELLRDPDTDPGPLSRALLRAALRDFDGIDPDHPGRALLALRLLAAMMNQDVEGHLDYAFQVVELVGLVDRVREAQPPQWAELRAMLRSRAIHGGRRGGGLDTRDAA